MSGSPPTSVDELVEHARSLDSRSPSPYDDPTRRAHYHRVALAVSERFEDDDLGAAAALHGLPEADLRHAGDLPEGVRTILEDWHLLRTIGPDESKGADHGFAGDARSLILSIYDCLDALDPDGDLLSFTERFHREKPLARCPLILTAAPPDELLARVERVVAPLARAWGFWMEGNTLLNAVLYHRSKAQWGRLVDYAREMVSSAEGVHRSLTHVRGLLKGEVRHGRITWEWRHLESIGRKLAGFRVQEWPRALFRCGFVTVSCQNPDHCYRVLGKLHGAGEYRRRELTDFIGAPSPSGYRALHTVLVTSDASDNSFSITVRLVPAEDSEQRHAFVDATRFTSLQLPSLGHREPRVRAYTPTGEQKRLPLGSTVLDFIYAVHKPWLAYAEHAVLNGTQQVGLLHVLEDGDEVLVELGDKPRSLPAGWEQGMTAKSRQRIRAACQQGWSRAVEAEGVAWLRRQLGRPQADDELVSVLVDLALPAFEAQGHAGHQAVWWLRQIGLHHGRLRPPTDLIKSRTDAGAIQALVACVRATALHLLRIDRRAEVDAPPALKAQTRRIHWCEICRPGRDAELAVTIAPREEGGEVVLHHAGEDCAEGGLPLHLQDRVALNQFFVIETNNEKGVALGVLEVFAQEDVDIIEVVGRRLGPDWGVFRVQVDAVDRRTIRRIVSAVSRLENVLSARSPLERQSGLLEAALPHRQTAHRNPFFRPFPFVAGPIVIEDHAFYARERERSALFDLLRRVRAADAEQGLMGFVRGPLRIGKTSLVRRFELLLRRQPDLGVLPVYVTAGRAQRWDDLKRRVDMALAAAAREASKLWDEELEPSEPGCLEQRIEALVALPQRPSVVIAIDEVHRLFGTCAQYTDDIKGITAFRDFIERTPGLLVVWCGPTYGARNLHREFSGLLQSAQHIDVRPFDFDDAHELLEARKLSLYHSITLDRELARHLYNLTGGEPFWLAHLAHLMWMRASESTSRIVRFDRALVERAKRDLLDKHELFATRIEPHAAARTSTHAWKIAKTLAHEQGLRARSRWGLTVDELIEAATARGYSFTPHAVNSALDTLLDRGAVRQIDAEPLRWRIAFRLLVEYLLLH